jgi:hypothetical protein
VRPLPRLPARRQFRRIAGRGRRRSQSGDPYREEGPGRAASANPRDEIDDRSSTKRRNETRSLRLMPALRVNSGTGMSMTAEGERAMALALLFPQPARGRGKKDEAVKGALIAGFLIVVFS